MAKFLSEDWFELLREVGGQGAERPGASARVQCTVQGTPDGEVVFHLVVEDGRLTTAQLGPDPAGETGVSLTIPYDDMLAFARGDLDPSAAFMQGRIKAVGDMTQLFALLPLAQGADAAEAAVKLAEGTEL